MMPCSNPEVQVGNAADLDWKMPVRQTRATDFLLKSYSVEQIARRVWQAMAQLVPKVEVSVEVPVSRTGLAAKEAAKVGFSNSISPRQWLANWKTTAGRILRGAFLSRLKSAGQAWATMPMSAFNLLAASPSTHFTSARKLTSVGLSGLALNMFLRLFTTLL